MADGKPSNTISFIAAPVTAIVMDVDEFEPTDPKFKDAVVVSVLDESGNTP